MYSSWIAVYEMLQVFVLHSNFSLPFRQGCVKLISLCLCFSYRVCFCLVCFVSVGLFRFVLGSFFGVGFVLVGLIGLFVLSGLFCVMDIEYSDSVSVSV